MQTPTTLCTPCYESPPGAPRRRRSTGNRPPVVCHRLGKGCSNSTASHSTRARVAVGLKVHGQLSISELARARHPLKRRGPVNQGLSKATLPRPPRQRALWHLQAFPRRNRAHWTIRHLFPPVPPARIQALPRRQAKHRGGRVPAHLSRLLRRAVGTQNNEIHTIEPVQQPLRLGVLTFTHKGERQQAHSLGTPAGPRQCLRRQHPSLLRHPRHPSLAHRILAHAATMCGSVSGAPRQKGQLSDFTMACPATLPIVHVARASNGDTPYNQCQSLEGFFGLG